MSTLIDPVHADALRDKFRADLEPVTVRVGVHLAACDDCARAEAILQELAALSPKIRVDRRAEEETRELPVISLEGAARGSVSFVGLPIGFEFPTLIDALFDVSSGSTSLSLEARQRLRALREEVHLRVFTTPT